MPYHHDDTHFMEKKKHIGNDNVTIVYNDSGEDYRMGTIKVRLSLVDLRLQSAAKNIDHSKDCNFLKMN